MQNKEYIQNAILPQTNHGERTVIRETIPYRERSKSFDVPIKEVKYQMNITIIDIKNEKVEYFKHLKMYTKGCPLKRGATL